MGTGHFVRTEFFYTIQNGIGEDTPSFIHFTGSFGSGKTVLLEQLREILDEQGYVVLHSAADASKKADFEVLKDSLKPKGMEDFIEDKPARVDTTFYIYKSGLTAGQAERDNMELDLDIMGGMVTAVEGFVKDSFSQAGKVTEITTERSFNLYQVEQYKLALFRFSLGNLACMLEGDVPRTLRTDLNSIADRIEKNFSDILTYWDGDETYTIEINQYLQVLIDKYDGLMPELEPDIMKMRRINRLYEKVAQHMQYAPLAILIDNIEKSDADTKMAINYLARNCRKNIVIMTASELSASESGLEAVLFTDMGLPPFTTEDARTLLGVSDLDIDVSMQQTEEMVSKTGGNPLLIVQTLERARESGKLTIPFSSIEEMMLHQMGQTSDDIESLKVLAYASIISMDGEIPFTVSRLKGLLGDETVAILHRLTQSGVFAPIDADGELYKFLIKGSAKALFERYIASFSANEIIDFAVEMVDILSDEPEPLLHFLQHVILQDGVVFSDTSKYRQILKEGKELAGKLADQESELHHYPQAIYLWKIRMSFLSGMADAMGADAGKEKILQEQIQTLSNICDASMVSSLYEDALMASKNCLELTVEAGDKKGEIDSLNSIAHVYSNQNAYPETKENAERALEKADALSYNLGMFQAHLLISFCHSMDCNDENIHHGKKALEIAMQLENLDMELEAIKYLGIAYTKLRDYNTSFDYKWKYLQMVKGTGSPNEEGKAWNNIGFAYEKLGKYQEAVVAYNKAIDLVEMLGNIWLLGLTYGNLATSKRMLGDLDGAEDAIIKSLDYGTKLGDKRILGIMYSEHGLVQALKTREKFNQAILNSETFIEEDIKVNFNEAWEQINTMRKEFFKD
jgi:tetratricopeptide (TPR) repeat protein